VDINRVVLEVVGLLKPTLIASGRVQVSFLLAPVLSAATPLRRSNQAGVA